MRVILQFLIVFFTIFYSFSSKSQDVSIIQISGMNFPNSGNANGNPYNKYDTLRKVLEFDKPEILIVKELQSLTAADSLLNYVLNDSAQDKYGYSWQLQFLSPGEASTGLFYDTTVINFIRRIDFVDTSRGRKRDYIYFQLEVKEDSSNIPLNLMVGAPFAGGNCGILCDSLRFYNVHILQNVLSQLPNLENLILCGSIDFSSRSDIAYQFLMDSMPYQFSDPIQGLGFWSGNTTNTSAYNFSTRNTFFDNGSPVGISSRVSFIFPANDIILGNAHLRYDANSYKTIGNDGNRNYGSSLLELPVNTLYAFTFLSSLYHLSDELPLSISMSVVNSSIIKDEEFESKVKVVNPIQNNILEIFCESCNTIKGIELYNLFGRRLLHYYEYELENIREISLPFFESQQLILKIYLENGEVDIHRLLIHN